MKISEEVGSKYRFIILAGQRVAQLQKGALPRNEGAEDMKSTTIATEELNEGLLKFRKLEDLEREAEELALNPPPELLGDTDVAPPPSGSPEDDALALALKMAEDVPANGDEPEAPEASEKS